jgi:hypothetical protein
MGPDFQQQLLARILLRVVSTLCLTMLVMMSCLLIGLFDSRVDNKEIFNILAMAFSTIVGAFVGMLGGLELKKGLGTSVQIDRTHVKDQLTRS